MAVLIAALPSAAVAQSSGRSAASTWYDAYGKTVSDRAVALQAAVEQERAQNGGFGPGVSTTTVNGDVVSYTTNNGPVSNSTAYNSVNSSTTTANASGTGVNITIETGQSSGTATQDARSGIYVGTATTSVACGGTNSCAPR